MSVSGQGRALSASFRGGGSACAAAGAGAGAGAAQGGAGVGVANGAAEGASAGGAAGAGSSAAGENPFGAWAPPPPSVWMTMERSREDGRTGQRVRWGC